MLVVWGAWGGKDSSEMMEGASHPFPEVLTLFLQWNKELSLTPARREQEDEAQVQLNK